MLNNQNLNNSSLIIVAVGLAQALDKVVDKAIDAKDLANIVKLHAKITAASLFIPIPGVAIGVGFANTWTMYARINKIVGISFSQSLLKSIAAGISSNLLSNLFVYGVQESLLFLIPEIGFFLTTLTMFTSTYVSMIAAGIVYMKALTFLLNRKMELTEVNLKEAVDSIMDDKGQQ